MTIFRTGPYPSRLLASRLAGTLVLMVFALPLLPGPVSASVQANIDMMGTVLRVIDGDTLDLASRGRVRLADIDAPEIGSPGAQEAANYLAGLVLNRILYLDVDTVRGVDRYDRIIAVVYVRHNATHLLNVNEALLQGNLADIANFPNEFNPDDWTLYMWYPTEHRSKAGASIANLAAIFIVVGAILGFFFRLLRPGR